MNYREYKKDGAKISLLGFGGMRFPTKDGKIDREKSQELIDKAYNSGVNYFDTAYMYHNGESELFFGEAMAKYPRDSYYLADKMPVWMAKESQDVERIFNEQLKKCNTDYFDFYLLHSVNDGVYKDSVRLGAFEKLDALRKSGKIKRLGFSFHGSIELLEKVLDEFEWDFVQIQLNYLDWDYQNAKRQYEMIVERGLQVLVMEPMRGGALVNVPEKAEKMFKALKPDDSVPSWAMKFAASLDGVLCILSGMTTQEALDDNLKTFSNDIDFDASMRDMVFEAAKIIIETKTIPCTKCNYCSDCPQGIAIPKIFSMYNGARISEDSFFFKESYFEMDDDKKPHNCIKCGICVQRCPQGIDVPSKLETVLEYANSQGV